MTTTTDPTVPARAELVALVTATRSDWQAADVHAAITHAGNTGMTWRRVMVELVRLAADPDAEPRDVVIDHRDPLYRGRPTVDPGSVVDLDALRRELDAAQTRTTGELPAIPLPAAANTTDQDTQP